MGCEGGTASPSVWGMLTDSSVEMVVNCIDLLAAFSGNESV